jgi:uroporphyrinogen-III decarboxylase
VTELEKLKRIVDGKIVIYGSAVLPRYLMPGTDYEKIKELVDYSMRAAAPGGGYVFSLSAILPGIDSDRFLFLTKYARKVGRYPVKDINSQS